MENDIRNDLHPNIVAKPNCLRDVPHVPPLVGWYYSAPQEMRRTTIKNLLGPSAYCGN